MNHPVLTLESLDESTAVLTLNRPERRNALSIELMESLCDAMQSLAAEPDRRVVILCGAGPVFCAGLDLYEAAEIECAEQSAQSLVRTFETLATSSLVTIAAAHGAAYAGGAGLLACCDFVMGAEDLRIGFPEVRRGLVAALAAAALLNRLRDGDLRELLLVGEPIDAWRAMQMGLIQRIVRADRLRIESQQIAAAVRKGAPEAVRHSKRLLNDLRGRSISEIFARALELHKLARLSDEAHEGLAAFRQRREPEWIVPAETNR